MNRSIVRVLFLVFAVISFAASLPLYFLVMIGVGMSPGKPHLGLPLACLLWAPALLCLVLSTGCLVVQKPRRIWCWVLAVPLIVCSAIEVVWTLLILLEG